MEIGGVVKTVRVSHLHATLLLYFQDKGAGASGATGSPFPVPPTVSVLSTKLSVQDYLPVGVLVLPAHGAWAGRVVVLRVPVFVCSSTCTVLYVLVPYNAFARVQAESWSLAELAAKTKIQEPVLRRRMLLWIHQVLVVVALHAVLKAGSVRPSQPVVGCAVCVALVLSGSRFGGHDRRRGALQGRDGSRH